MIQKTKSRPPLIACLIGSHLTTLCWTVGYASKYHAELIQGDLSHALLIPTFVLALALPLAFLFELAEFSFGYFVGFYLYQMVAGFLFLNTFIEGRYNHSLAAASALCSAILFLIPALFFICRPRSMSTLSPRNFEVLLHAILLFAFSAFLVGAAYSFRIDFASLSELRNELFTARLRNNLTFPAPLRYLIALFSSALLPFAFAYFLQAHRYWKAALCLAMMALFFPITLSKTTLFAPAWLLFIAMLAKTFEPRVAAIASLAIPLLVGLLSVLLWGRNDAFDLLAYRMIHIPSAALVIYNDFFAQHEQTYFCQLSFAKLLMSCPYEDQLGAVMQKAYGFGNYNASLFATEGIASLGVAFAPISALACGLIVALGNLSSARVSANTLLISSSILCQAILNVPLSTALLTHGGGLLFLLWYVAPAEALQISDPGLVENRTREPEKARFQCSREDDGDAIRRN